MNPFLKAALVGLVTYFLLIMVHIAYFMSVVPQDAESPAFLSVLYSLMTSPGHYFVPWVGALIVAGLVFWRFR